ncbi:hypothetical protein [Paeniclostridium hominis]|uniref:hypothetical protein n=1 Tax=Paeniclostridium hominis TaxID=2764329 RepID=UPI0022E2E83A|nr:hypothetical protein [Paeniclostridium hominis]
MSKKSYLYKFKCRGELEHSDIVHKSVGFVINNAIDKDNRGLYDATTGCWKCSLDRAQSVELVFSLYRTYIVGIWIPKTWEITNDGTRIRWQGDKCSDKEILERYLYKKVPKSYSVVRYYGMQNK